MYFLKGRGRRGGGGSAATWALHATKNGVKRERAVCTVWLVEIASSLGDCARQTRREVQLCLVSPCQYQGPRALRSPFTSPCARVLVACHARATQPSLCDRRLPLGGASVGGGKGGEGLQRSGVDPPMCSSRACLHTAFDCGGRLRAVGVFCLQALTALRPARERPVHTVCRLASACAYVGLCRFVFVCVGVHPSVRISLCQFVSTLGRKQVNKARHTCTSWYAYAAMFGRSSSML